HRSGAARLHFPKNVDHFGADSLLRWICKKRITRGHCRPECFPNFSLPHFSCRVGYIYKRPALSRAKAVVAEEGCMWRDKTAYFLVLLVLSFSSNDLGAAATPDPDDDDWATEDNTLVQSVRPFEWGRPGGPVTERVLLGGVHKAHVSQTASVRYRRPERN